MIEPGTATLADVSHMKEKASLSLGKKAVLCAALEGPIVATGSADGTISLVDWAGAKSVGSGQGARGKAVHALGWVAGQGSSRMLLSGAADATVKLWSVSSGGAMSVSHDFTHLHGEAVSSVAVHPCQRLFASAAKDATWALVDLQTTSTVYSVEGQEKFATIRFHPDGLLLATAGDDAQNSLRIWDVKSKENVMALNSHSAPIASIAFSENGYFLASGGRDGSVLLWDLRNLEQPLLSRADFGATSAVVECVAFDHSGQYLAFGGKNVLACYNVLDDGFKHAATLSGHKGAVHALAWSRNASVLVSGASDGVVKMWGH